MLKLNIIIFNIHPINKCSNNRLPIINRISSEISISTSMNKESGSVAKKSYGQIFFQFDLIMSPNSKILLPHFGRIYPQFLSAPF